MGSVNRVILVGNLGADAELRYTGGGAAVANFRLATTEVFKDKDGARPEQTEWHRVSLWGKQVYVEGRLQTRKWQDKEGHDRYSTEVRADRVVLLGGGPGRGQSMDREEMHEPSHAPAEMPAEDDVPF